MAAALLAADRVGWRYRRGPWVLDDVSLTVPGGGLLRVRGGNGAGKSTLLRVLAGTVAPRRGAVRRSGPVAYLPQQTEELPPVAAGRLLALLGSDGDLRGHRGTRADQLSEGWQRRLLLTAVLDLPCAIVVLDEPAAGLDDDAVHLLAERLTARLAAGHAVVVAEHEPLPLDGGDVLELGGRPVPAGTVRVVLGGAGGFRGAVAVGGRLTLTVPVDERDALLLAALGEGWSVLSVGPGS